MRISVFMDLECIEKNKQTRSTETETDVHFLLTSSDSAQT